MKMNQSNENGPQFKLTIGEILVGVAAALLLAFAALNSRLIHITFPKYLPHLLGLLCSFGVVGYTVVHNICMFLHRNFVENATKEQKVKTLIDLIVIPAVFFLIVLNFDKIDMDITKYCIMSFFVGYVGAILAASLVFGIAKAFMKNH